MGQPGESGPATVSRTIAMVIAACFALSCYNVLEINISIFNTFKRRSGLYFWSMLAASWGIAIYATSSFLRMYSLAPNFPMSVFMCIGWYGMVTAQALVLYSRLHLVVHDPRPIRWILIMIITNACIFHIPITILFLGVNLGATSFSAPFNVYEKLQLTGFSIQELIISGIYIWKAINGLKPLLAFKGHAGRNIVVHLILVNVIVVFMDVSLLITEYTNHLDIQIAYQTVVYSIKLKMEFSILNRLMTILQGQNCECDYIRLHNTSAKDTVSTEPPAAAGVKSTGIPFTTDECLANS